ncbi:MAG TPA: DUF302 domain-containing protein [Acidimicrobiales bacterium]|nr:DUF302 domain-containing protein [Acidimicrobiales bacterium]
MPAGLVEIVTKSTNRSVEETVNRFVDTISTKGLRLFDVIDQRAEAREVGLDLRETVLVLFGDPRAGTPVMASSPLIALDLPLKVLVWSDAGKTKVSYESPLSLAARHHLQGEFARNLDGIDALTDALVAFA